ncbi:hypothetical protein SAMN04487911_1447 [Arenibacter nanhaiticus]|uniref:Uncharacterized protein n=1 Tax=Arenibacter nanhaiticus TaxID=558155 RepID=A0A1M6MLM9_9FLAO|nr:hypothetical protein SAMN04487911_1447 [Arenibacter nanhaiticus]
MVLFFSPFLKSKGPAGALALAAVIFKKQFSLRGNNVNRKKSEQ